MTPEEFERERLESAAALRKAADSARPDLRPRTSAEVLGPAPDPGAMPSPVVAAALPPWSPPAPPDLRPVNDSWRTEGTGGSGSLLAALDGREARQAQARFNSDQVQLDNALVSWTAEHFAATHRHYDAVIALMQKRMDEIDTRHRELEKELVRHVHEMARRIDVVLGEGEKGRVSHEAALRSIRERLKALEEKLG